jgi:hypothetical protein
METVVRDLAEKIGLKEFQFGRSLVEYGTIPLPESLWDYFVGQPGKNAALPYMRTRQDIDSERAKTCGETRSHTGKHGDVEKCCLPTVKDDENLDDKWQNA